MSQGRIDTRYLIVITILGLSAISAFFGMAMEMGEDFAVPGLIALGVVGAVIFRGPVGKALARRIESGPSAEPPSEILHELDDVRGRLLELEERLDFTERMLSKAREPEKINGPLR
jgi:hypothetical protein